MKLHPLMSTMERELILGYLFGHPSEKINMNKLARELKLSVGQIHKYVSLLRKYGFVSKDKLQQVPIICALRLLWNMKMIGEKGLVRVLRRHFKELKGVGIFGSWALGTNLERADLDVWVKMDEEPEDIDLAKTKREMESKMKVPVDIIIATPETLEHFRRKSDAFYFSLYNGRLLWGEGL